MSKEPKQNLEKEMFELEQELDIPSSLRWHNSKPKQEMSYANNEITLEDVFNDEKKKNLKEFIDKHKKKK
jgi:hypothetical protein